MQPLAGGVSSDIWRVELARGPVCVKRALAAAQGRRRLAGAGRAQRLRGGAGCGSRPHRARAARRACSRERPGGRRVRDGVPAAGALPAVEGRAARRPRRSRVRARRSASGWPRIHAATAGRAGIAAAVPDRRDLPRDPARALPARDRAARIPTSRAASSALARAHRRHRARAGPRRRQPEEHPGRPATGRCSSTPSAPGTATRPSTSPSASTTCCSSACGRRRRPRGFLACFDALGAAYLDGADWEPRGALERARGERCCRGCCSPASTASRRSST